jgi:alpha/beta superfamily hydrolase
VKDFPVFVPVPGAHVAAVVTVPDGEPRALIALFQGGGGAPRSYYNSLWTIVSRSLAELGFASVRLDWRAVGDSTGEFHMTMDRPPVDDALAAIELAMRATGTTRVGAAGMCVGGVTALGAAERLGPACQSICVIKLLVHNKRRVTAQDRRKKSFRRRVLMFASRHPSIDRVLRRYYWKAQMQDTNPVLRQLARLRQQAPIMLTGFKAEMKLPAVFNALQRKYRTGAFEIRELPLEGPMGLQDRLGYQRAVVEQLAEWFDRTLPAASSAHPNGDASVRSAPVTAES